MIIKQNGQKELECILKLYKDYHNSVEELQNVLMLNGSGSLITSLFDAKDENFENFLHIIKNELLLSLEILEEEIHIFCKNIYRSFNCIKKLKTFEKFLINNFNENLSKKFVRTTLFTKQDFHNEQSLINDALTKNNAEALELTLNLLRNYSESPEEILNYLKSAKFENTWFLNYMNDEIYQIFKNFLIDVFDSNDEIILKFLNFQIIIWLNKNEEGSKFLENFLKDFFRNDVSLIRKSIRKVLFTKDDNNFIIFPNDSNTVKNFFAFLLKYKNSNEEIKNLFITGKLKILARLLSSEINNLLITFLDEIFDDKKELLKCFRNELDSSEIICNEKKFKDCLKFLSKLFKNDTILINDCIRNILFGKFRNHCHPLFIGAKSMNINDFIRISDIYLKYANSIKDLQEVFLQNELLISIFSNISDINIQRFKNFVKKVFESDKEKLVDCINSDEGCSIILNKDKFEIFHNFLSEFVTNNIKREAIRKLLFYDYRFYYHPITETTKYFVKSSTHSFEDVKILYLKYSNSLEELQDIFKQNNLLFYTIMTLDDKIHDSFAEFLSKIFKNNMNNLDQFMKIDTKCQYFFKTKQFDYIVKFLKQAKCNENQIDSCIIKILSSEYLPQNHPVVTTLKDYSDDDKDIFTIYIKNKCLQNNLKNVFMTQKIILPIFQEMELKRIDKFIKFMEDIFQLERSSFRKNFMLKYNKFDFKDLGRNRKAMLKSFLLNFVFKNDEDKFEIVKKYFLLIDIPKLFPNEF